MICLQAIDQMLFMVTSQPSSPTITDQFPNKQHGGLDGRTSIDHISTKDKLSGARKHLE
jgi:hypothetical protein